MNEVNELEGNKGTEEIRTETRILLQLWLKDKQLDLYKDPSKKTTDAEASWMNCLEK